MGGYSGVRVTGRYGDLFLKVCFYAERRGTFRGCVLDFFWGVCFSLIGLFLDLTNLHLSSTLKLPEEHSNPGVPEQPSLSSNRC